MDFIADLHIHSPYSRATSKESTLTGLAAWARVKGIQLLGTGDFTHPGWFKRLKEELEPAEPGLFRLRDEAAIPSPLPGVTPLPAPIRFLLSAEISSIYKRHGVVRKVHNILYLPDFASAERLNAKLAGIGNIESDGRPILGLDSRNLLEILLEQAPEGFLVPAHIWTPWFSLFGSKSGFDDIEECFGDLTGHIFALETGLSSDPAMNRLISGLDRFALISNSDCHSPGKLGREANLFSTELDFFAVRDAIKGNRRDSFRGTIEFFPEEGKYHFDGHRKCNVCLDPHEARRLGLICPVCGKPVTVGVHHRVMELADRELPLSGADAPEFFSLIPLPEVLGELLGVGPASKEVMGRYAQVIGRFGSEFNLLLQAPLDEISQHVPLLGEAIGRMRRGEVVRNPGFDGEFGVIRVFEEGELAKLAGQGSLFGDAKPRRGRQKKDSAGPLAPLTDMASLPPQEEKPGRGPNPEQEAAITSRSRHILVAAGPGTGKTHTLVARLAALLAEGADPLRICAITFTTKAAAEVRERLIQSVGPGGGAPFVGTFHRFCLDWLQREDPGLTVVGPDNRARLLKRLFPALSVAERASLGKEIADFVERFGCGTLPGPPEPIQRYFAELDRLAAIDLDGVIPSMVTRLQADADFGQRFAATVAHLFVDEFQDLNASQFALVQLLAWEARVFAIGDPDQAIYGFRGSDLAYFFRFAELPDTERLSLSRNYRSAPAIIAAAGAVISHNSQRSGLSLTPQNRGVGAIELYKAPTPAAEAEFIVRRIEELMGGVESFSLNSGRGGDLEGRGRSFGDMAILVRLGKQAEEIAQALARRGIPCQQVGVTPFFMGPALRPAFYFLQAAADSTTIADWLNLLGSLKGVGATTVDRLEALLPLNGDFLALVSTAPLAPVVVERLAGLAQTLELFRAQAAAVGLSAALDQVLAFLGIEATRPETVRLLELANSFGTSLPAFCNHLRQSAAATVYDERAEAVALMTCHAAKGLEFPVVFLAGLEEGLLPCTLMGSADMEEERRLFYVALTRAKERLLLTWAAARPWAGPGPRQLSRFVGEIPQQFITQAAAGPKKRKGQQEAEQLELLL